VTKIRNPDVNKVNPIISIAELLFPVAGRSGVGLVVDVWAEIVVVVVVGDAVSDVKVTSFPVPPT
jgi:hypothetical protein